MQVFNITRDTQLARNVLVADTFWLRLKGLLGKDSLPPGDGLLLQPCNSVHGWGMQFACEVVYLSRENRVLFVQTLQPWRCGPILFKAVKVLELSLGSLAESKTRVGDTLLFS